MATLSFSRIAVAAAILTAASTCGASNAYAQIHASERGSASQTVDGTTIAVDYARPQLRGRTPFPNIVRWGEVWTPGANWAATLASNRPFKVGGHAVAAGSYSLWMVPDEKAWTVHLHRESHLFHEARPPVAEMLFGVAVTPEVVKATEVLTLDFPEVRRDGMTLQLRWGTVAVRVPIEVEPSDDGSAFDDREAARYVGRYTRIRVDDKGATTRDSIEIHHQGKRLVVLVADVESFILVHAPAAPGVLFVAFFDKAGIVNVEDSSPVTVTMAGGRATELWAHGARPGTTWFRALREN